MSTGFTFEHHTAFHPDGAEGILRAIPAAPGICALRGERENAQPYLTRAADLRRRLRRLLLPPEALAVPDLTAPSSEDQRADTPPPTFSKRLNLRNLVRSIEWTETGSEFESTLLLYHATRAEFGPERARERLKLRPPFVVRLTVEHDHPRLYVTNRLSRRSLPESFGPFPSRAAAERYAEAVGDLFKLRRCHEDLVVHPEHPGCAYGEMKLCLAPCKAAVSATEYHAEAARALDFLRTGGDSLLHSIGLEREAASERMDFEAAAALHTRWEKVKTAASLADELVRPLADLRALVVQEAAPLVQTNGAGRAEEPRRASEAAVFLLEAGHLAGPERLSTLGVRAVREQTAVGSSLFAQPLMLSALPLGNLPHPFSDQPAEPPPQPAPPLLPDFISDENSAAAHISPGALHASGGPDAPDIGAAFDTPAASAEPTPITLGTTTLNLVTLSPEERASHVLAHLREHTIAHIADEGPPTPADLADTLALFRRWYFRPEKQRAGEVFLPNPDGGWPLRRLLNGAARVVLGPPGQLSPVDRQAASEAAKSIQDSAKPAKTRVLHPGREGVERVVPVLPKRPGTRTRSRKAILPGDVVA